MGEVEWKYEFKEKRIKIFIKEKLVHIFLFDIGRQITIVCIDRSIGYILNSDGYI